MFEGDIAVETLRDLLEAVTAVAEECQLGLGEDALTIRTVDPATIAMIDLELSAEATQYTSVRSPLPPSA